LRIYVFGWYGNGNLGDEAFKISFQQLWPKVDFTFGNCIPPVINDYDQLWVGGGSFLNQPISNLGNVKIPTTFIGVGVSEVHPANLPALKNSDVICRDVKSLSLVQKITTKSARSISDLVFARKDLQEVGPRHPKKQIVVLANDFLTPSGNVPDWKSLSYYWFIQEYAKVLDRFAEQGYRMLMLPMCVNAKVDDRRAAAAILGRSKYPEKYIWNLMPTSEEELLAHLLESELLITQRFHGIVYGMVAEIPTIAIKCHDKFTALTSLFNLPAVDYYGFTDAQFNVAKDGLASFSFSGVRDYRKVAFMVWNEIRRKLPDYK